MKKYFKEFKKFIKKLNIDFWLKIFTPSIFVIGIIWQIIILSKYNAVVFFSWSQVLSDAIIFTIPLLGFFLGYCSNVLFSKLEPKIWQKIASFLFILLIYFVANIILTLISGDFNFYFAVITIFFIVGYISSLSTFLKDNKKQLPQWLIFIFPSLIFVLIPLVLFLLSTLIDMEYKQIYKNIKIEINGIQKQVQYINDKYIIYGSGNVISNNGTAKFIISGEEK